MHQSGGPDVSSRQVAPAGYRLIHLLGRGGMGEVYLADDLTLGRRVAIKFLLLEKTNDPAARRRLLREAQAAAALDHPHICTVYETGETADGRVYVVMQYVEGETLSSVLQRGPLPARDALTLCAHLADALAAAHRRGIIHRDLKPANVIVTPSGRPKLLDLGIAKVASATTVGDASTWSNVTAPGSLVGTPGYMSPEQVQQRPLDGRCDLFCLGVLLFECLTGRRAFDGTTTFETIANVLHVHPPAPSSIRPELSERHDELCRRLMAKDPNDRFQSADEVMGAIRIIAPDTSRTWADEGRESDAAASLLRAKLIAVVILVALSAWAVWLWTRPRALPPVSETSQRWYSIGTEAIREGSYFSAIKALQEAIDASPEHVLAYARLAEAHAELDDDAEAKNQLLKVSSRVPNESRLPEVERVRLQAVRALVLRDVDGAVALYRRLADLVSDEPGAWLDLGRAQEAAGLRIAALGSYQRAVEQDPTYAAAWLRRGTLLGLESKRAEALKAFEEAERLYQATSNEEGEAEVLIRRGALFDALIEPTLARVDLQRAHAIAERLKSNYQLVRIQLALSSVTASDGHFDKAREIAETAVREAVEHRLESVAAGGLVNLAGLVQGDRLDEAETLLERAIRLAEGRQARRTVAWARLQLAHVRLLQNRNEDSLALLEAELPFLQANRYRRFELYALSIKTRALQGLDNLDEAGGIAAIALSIAESVHDEGQIVLAGSNVASVYTALGRYPEALRLRERVEAIRVRQQDLENLPYDLANRADLLIRLGRFSEADGILSSFEQAIAKNVAAYVRLNRRISFLRALAAASALRCNDVARFLEHLPGKPIADDAGVIGPAVRAFCDVHRTRRIEAIAAVPPGANQTALRDRQYWLAAAALEGRDANRTLEEVQRALTLLGDLSNDEMRWRLAALAAAAARDLGDHRVAEDKSAIANAAFGKLKSEWGQDFQTYGQRADLLNLRKRAGLP